MIVVADTSPLNYLVLIGEALLLHELFGQVLIPPAVFDELQDEETPQAVRAWVAEIPSWLKVIPIDLRSDPALDFLDEGEREAIALAEQVQADRILLDETAA